MRPEAVSLALVGTAPGGVHTLYQLEWAHVDVAFYALSLDLFVATLDLVGTVDTQPPNLLLHPSKLRVMVRLANFGTAHRTFSLLFNGFIKATLTKLMATPVHYYWGYERTSTDRAH